MKSNHLYLNGIPSRRLILLPEELPEERAQDHSPAARRASRPRIRRYRLGVLAGAAPAGGAPPKLARLAP